MNGKRLALAHVVAGLVGVLACLVSAVAPVDASFPGRNGTIVFERQGAHGEWTLWSLDPSSGREHQLTRVPPVCAGQERTWTDQQASFSTSGQQLVYTHEDACDPRRPDGIYVMRSDGSGHRLLLRDRPDKWRVTPAFSPGDRWLTFTFESDKAAREVATTSFQHLDDARPAVRGFPRYDYQNDPSWSATGRLALALGTPRSLSGSHIATVAANGQHLRLVTRSMRDWQPDWSPTASHIVFRREAVGTSKRFNFRGDVFVAPARHRGHRRPRRLTFSRDAFTPVWSPNGRYIAYVRAPDLVSPNGSLWIMSASDGQQQRLVARRVVAGRISWQPRPRR
jgi:Tol biopolymer transport system component